MEQNIEEGNKLIAEFMGYKLITPEMRREPEKWYIKGKPSCYWENPLLKGCKRVLCGEFQLSYHYSWNELMPVVEYIETLFDYGIDFNILTDGVIIQQLRDKFEGEYHSPIDIIRCTRAEIGFNYKLEAVWLAVVEFIKWYNQQK